MACRAMKKAARALRRTAFFCDCRPGTAPVPPHLCLILMQFCLKVVNRGVGDRAWLIRRQPTEPFQRDGGRPFLPLLSLLFIQENNRNEGSIIPISIQSPRRPRTASLRCGHDERRLPGLPDLSCAASALRARSRRRLACAG